MNVSEKLILAMLSDIHKALKIKSDLDPSFISEAIAAGQTWALAVKYRGLLHGEEPSAEEIENSGKYMTMWRALESAYSQFSPEQKVRLQDEAEPFGKDVSFPGFDANNEAEYSAARFRIEHLDQFEEFRGRALNAHMPTIQMHERIFQVFDGIMKESLGRPLDLEQTIRILRARRHPDAP